MLTLDEALPLFEAALGDDHDRSALTIKAYRADAQAFVVWLRQSPNAPQNLAAITPTHVKAYRAALSDDQHQKASSINRRLAALHAFFKWAVEAEWLKRSPLNGLKGPRQQQTAPRWLEPAAEYRLQQALEQRLQLVSAEANDWHIYRDVALVVLMWKAGLRVSEVVALDVDDVKVQSSKRGTIHVRHGKGGKQRTVPMNATVIAAVKDWQTMRPDAGQALFLSKTCRHLTTRAIQQIVEQIGREAAALMKTRSTEDRAMIEALNALSPHVLRHTAAKRLLDAGAQLTEVAEILGHEDLNITRRYTQPGEEDLHRAMDRTVS
jgi:site-specific recombinase XerD